MKNELKSNDEDQNLISPLNPGLRFKSSQKNILLNISNSQNESNKPLISAVKNENFFKQLNQPKSELCKTNSLRSNSSINNLRNSTENKKLSSSRKKDSVKEEKKIPKNLIKKTLSHKSFKEDEEPQDDDDDESSFNNHLQSNHEDKSDNDDQSKSNSDKSNSEGKEEKELSEEEMSIKDPEVVNRNLYKREKICGTDSEDEGSDNEKEVPWVILPDNPYKRLWDLAIAIIILYSSIVTPYEIAFIDKTKDSWSDFLLDAFLWLDIVITFFSAYTDSEENLVKNHKKIIITYLKTWFIVDLVSVLPINQMTSTSFAYNKITRISRLPKLYRLVKLTKLLRMTRMTAKGNVNKVTKFFLEKLKINANIERLIFFVLTFLLLNHLCACFWYFMAKLEDLSPDSWVVRLGYVDSSNFELYIISFYWTLTTVTTVGYGDINAGTTIERVYNLFIMSFGVLLYSFAIGSLSSIVSTLDQKTAEMNQKLQILSSIKKEFNLDQSIYDKVRKVIKFDLSRNQKDKMMFLQELPNKLRIELSQIMHDKVIQNLYFFRDQPSDFFAYVAPLLKPVKFSQNDYLYKCQDMIDESKNKILYNI